MDYYLKTESEVEMLAAVEVAISQGHAFAIDVIGEWHERSGGTDEEPIYSPVPGWHFNVRSDEPISWPEFVTVTNPATPWRIWG